MIKCGWKKLAARHVSLCKTVDTILATLVHCPIRIETNTDDGDGDGDDDDFDGYDCLTL